jgi:hypothetical protein
LAAELDAKDAPSDEDKEELENLRRTYEATKTAKANIVREGLSKQLWDAKAANGLDGLRAVIDEASKSQLRLAKKSEEFPKDETTANELGAAETNIRLLYDELLAMAQSNEVSSRETDGITEIAVQARTRESYNRIYA